MYIKNSHNKININIIAAPTRRASAVYFGLVGRVGVRAVPSDGGLLVAAHLAGGVDVPLGVVVLADVHAQVAALLGAVGAVGTLVGGRLAAALHVFVPPQRGLPTVSLAAVPTLELATGVVVVAARLLVVLGPGPRERRVRLVGQHDVVGVVRLALRLRLLLVEQSVRVRVMQQGGEGGQRGQSQRALRALGGQQGQQGREAILVDLWNATHYRIANNK